MPGIFKDTAAKASNKGVAIFSYAPNEQLAQMIVDAWVDNDFRTQLTDRNTGGTATDMAKNVAKSSLAARLNYMGGRHRRRRNSSCGHCRSTCWQ